MRVVITTAGSRGDLQPYVALGQALARAGHEVVLATHGPYEAFVRGHGLGFRAIAGDPLALLQSPEGLAWLDARSNPIAFVRRCHELLGPRLIACTRLVNAVAGKSAHDIFGSPDDLKFRSCVTLFHRAAPDEAAFGEALRKYFGGVEDAPTVELVASA